MVFLNLQIGSIIDALNTAGYIPSSLLAGGATTATVEVTATEPTSPIAGDLWFNTSINVLTIYNGIAWQEVSLTADEKSQLASLSTAVSQAQSAELGAIDARDTILGMTASTGIAGSLVTWNSTTGVLTIPVGATGATGNGIMQTAFTSTTDISGLAGQSGATDTYTITYSNAATNTILVYNGLDSAVLSVAGRTGNVVLTKADVGLANVDNTSDSDKPVSTATQLALNGKVDDAQVLTNVPLGAVFTDTIFTGGNLTGALNEARATVISHATTADIWTALGNQIDWTGTATTTAFPNATQAGAERTLICAGACSFTASANMLIDGVASGNTVTCAAGDTVIVRAISITQFKLTRLKVDGMAQVSAEGGLKSVQAFTSSGTWTKPVGITKIKVTTTGAGGSGAALSSNYDTGSGGGAGGTSIGFIDVSSISSGSVTIGAGGAAVLGNANNAGNAGGTSSFVVTGTTLTAGGGAGGAANTLGLGGVGGTASGGYINIKGGSGQSTESTTGDIPSGGSSFYGGSGYGGARVNSEASLAYGSGGAAVSQETTDRYSGAGAQGIIIVEEYA